MEIPYDWLTRIATGNDKYDHKYMIDVKNTPERGDQFDENK